MAEKLKLNDLEKFGILIGSASHDVGHFGFNNPYLIEINHPVSLIYNEKSVLENMHSAIMFEII